MIYCYLTGYAFNMHTVNVHYIL